MKRFIAILIWLVCLPALASNVSFNFWFATNYPGVLMNFHMVPTTTPSYSGGTIWIS